MDFKKAFDSVDYKNLIDTLLSYGINGKVLDVINSLYAKVKSCVRGQNSLTYLFSCHRGVMQGCLLSPLLFTLFLNDLDSKINDVSTGVRLVDRTNKKGVVPIPKDLSYSHQNSWIRPGSALITGKDLSEHYSTL